MYNKGFLAEHVMDVGAKRMESITTMHLTRFCPSFVSQAFVSTVNRPNLFYDVRAKGAIRAPLTDLVDFLRSIKVRVI